MSRGLNEPSKELWEVIQKTNRYIDQRKKLKKLKEKLRTIPVANALEYAIVKAEIEKTKARLQKRANELGDYCLLLRTADWSTEILGRVANDAGASHVIYKHIRENFQSWAYRNESVDL